MFYYRDLCIHVHNKKEQLHRILLSILRNTHRGSYMGTHVLLNLVNELMKID